MGNTKTKVSVTLDDDLIVILRRQADKEDRSLSQYMNYALKQYETQRIKKSKRVQAKEGRSDYSSSPHS